MPCYVCAHLGSQKPKTPRPLPAGSPARPTDELGACNICGILACSLHGARSRLFECSMCVQAKVINDVVGVPPTQPTQLPPDLQNGVARRMARGLINASEVQPVVAQGIQKIAFDQDEIRLGRRSAENLVVNFSDVMGRRLRELGLAVFIGRDPSAYILLGQNETPLNLQSIGDSIAMNFWRRRSAAIGDHDVEAVLGAFAWAYDLADDETNASPSAAEPYVRLVPPWEVTHPDLLDPSVWLLGSAMFM
jgi:hypothetical protein